MTIAPNLVPAQSDVRFLEYRLDVVQGWPPSARKDATGKAITRRLLAIARSALTRPGVDDMLASTCRLLDQTFAADGQETDAQADFSGAGADTAFAKGRGVLSSTSVRS